MGTTKEKVKERIAEMVRNQVLEEGYIMKRATSILNSGALDLENHDDDFFIPMIILHVVLKNLSAQYAPLSDTGREIAKNLKHF